MAKIEINLAAVKVMRSYDYCHFQVKLVSSLDCPPDSAEWFGLVDNLRKNAARLADKAVDQYKVAKAQRERTDLNRPRYDYEDDWSDKDNQS